MLQKIIQTDFKKIFLPLFSDGKIFYDYSSKIYKAKKKQLFTKTLFLVLDEIIVIAILKNKSKDKYSDEDLSLKVDVFYLKV